MFNNYKMIKKLEDKIKKLEDKISELEQEVPDEDNIRNIAEWEDVLEEPIQVYLEGIQEVHSGGGRVFIDYATAKEAELAVRKLKAWKRLTDKGFRFLGCGFKVDDERIIIKAYCPKGFINDLELLFGGEEWLLDV